MDKIPEDHDARLAFLEGWAKGQRGRLETEEQRRLKAEEIARAEEQRRRYAEQIAHVVAQARQRAVDVVREAAAIPVVITKPPDPPVDRATVFGDLMVGLREYEWADPVVSECDEPRYIAPTAIELARRHRPDARWLLYMEDDVILGPDFGLLRGLLSEADELFPNAGLVSFFFSGSFGAPGWSIHPLALFSWLQCVAIRNTDFLAGFPAFIDSVPDTVPTSQATRPVPWPDRALATFLDAEYDAFALWCPSLVQHADLASVFFSQPTGRRISWSYKQAYG